MQHRIETGVFFRALALTVGTALLTSLGLALTWTPTTGEFGPANGREFGDEDIRTLPQEVLESE